MHALPAAPIRARLHPGDIQALITQMHVARDPHDLLNIVLAGVYTPLLAAQGRSLLSLTPHDRIDTHGWLLPAPQVEAIIAAACNRAAAWGAAANVGLILLSKLPSGFPDDEPVRAVLGADYRPAQMHLTVDRDASQVFLSANAHLKTLAACYGPTHRFHLDALSSWIEAVTLLLGVNLGPHTTVRAVGELGLQITTSGGVSYQLGYEPLPRTCQAGDGCQAVFTDDGLITDVWHDIAGHVHRPAYPRTAVKPGMWRTRTSISPAQAG